MRICSRNLTDKNHRIEIYDLNITERLLKDAHKQKEIFMSATFERQITLLADGKILQRVADGIGTLTFNNIEKHNAMSLDMWETLGVAMHELTDDPIVRVIILTGAGNKGRGHRRPGS